jgi:ABC-type lipoprotein release transport system permease subunit
MKWIQKQRLFLDFTLASMWRRRWKNISLLSVYTLAVFLIASVTFFSGAVRREAELLLRESPELIVQRVVAGRHALIPETYIDDIEAIPGVRSVTPRLWGYYYHPAAKSNYTLMVPENFSHADTQAVIGQGVRRTWGTVQDNRLFFQTSGGEPISLEVAGEFASDSELVSADLILLSETAFRNIGGVPEGFATDLWVRIRNSRECETIAQKILAIFPDSRPILKEEIQRTYATVFDWRSGYMIVLFSGVFFAFLIFAWDRATGLNADERAEIGILKAVGWDTADVLAIKFWEGLSVSLSAFLFGVISAYIHVYFASASLFEHALKGWAVLYPKFQLFPAVNAFHLSVLFFLTVVPYTFVTIVPAWRTAVTDPDTVMR